MTKKKILHVYKCFYPSSIGGIEKFIFDISFNLNKKFSFGVFCLGDKTKYFKYKNIRIFQFKKNFEISSCPFSIDALLNFKKIASNFDLIHYHYPYPFMDILSLTSKSKSIVTYHSDIIKQKILIKIYNFLQKYFLSKQKSIITTSKNYFISSKTLKQFAKKIKIIPFGINVQKNIKIKKSKIAKFIFFVGAIRYYKGLDTLLFAAKNINCNILIAGTGKELAKLKSLKKKLKLDNVFFLGKVSENKKNFLLKNCELFVFPSNSRAEAFGYSLLEALSFGRPLISCDIKTGTSFINQNNKTGFVVPPNNPINLSKKINFLLDNKNKKILKKFSKNSLLRFKDHFTINKMIKKYCKLYSNFI